MNTIKQIINFPNIWLYIYRTVFIICILVLITILENNHKEVIKKLDDIDNKEIYLECN